MRDRDRETERDREGGRKRGRFKFFVEKIKTFWFS